MTVKVREKIYSEAQPKENSDIDNVDFICKLAEFIMIL